MSNEPRKMPKRVTLGVSPKSPIGVAIAAYSGYRSRMVAWDAKTLKLIGYQDLKARASLLDISDCGQYCAYDVEKHANGEHYVAISKPPYFHALWIQNCVHLCHRSVVFNGPHSVHFLLTEKNECDWGRLVPEAVAPRCPFIFTHIPEPPFLIAYDFAISRSSGFADYARCIAKAAHPQNWREHLDIADEWSGTDIRGRTISESKGVLHANGVAFLSLERQEFEAIPPPEWAKSW